MKVALTVNKEDVLQIPNEFINDCTILLNQKSDEYLLTQLPYLEDLEFELQDRAVCETDFSRLQPLPYITIFNKTTKKFFTYLRGKGGDEGRLHDKLSIGLGGHVDELVYNDDASLDLNNTILLNIIKELSEEASIKLSDEHLVELLNSIKNKEYKLIYTTFDDVAKVHLCMWFCIELEEDELSQFEEGIILEPRWFSFDEFEQMINDTGTELEYWSQICYKMLKEKYNK